MFQTSIFGRTTFGLNGPELFGIQIKKKPPLSFGEWNGMNLSCFHKSGTGSMETYPLSVELTSNQREMLHSIVMEIGKAHSSTQRIGYKLEKEGEREIGDKRQDKKK